MPSTVIASFTYDAATHTLTVQFRSGLVYRYKDVPEQVYHDMKAYREKGIFLNRYIKGKYTYEKMNGNG
jgi:hypothetical protein